MNKQPSHNKIINAVANFYNVRRKDLLGTRRQKKLVKSRQVAMYLLREILNKSYPWIGRVVGNKDHTTAIHSYNKIKLTKENDVDFRQELERILNIISAEELKTLLPKSVSLSVSDKDGEEYSQLERTIEELRKRSPSLVTSEREKSMLEEWRSGKTLEKIGIEWKLTRERIRQIITRGILREIANKVNEGFEIDVQEFLKQEKNQRKNLQDKLYGKIKIEEKKDSDESRRWSRFYARCRQCGTTVIPHRSHGLCIKCSGIIVDREGIIKEKGEKCEVCGIQRVLALKQFGRDLYVTHANKKGVATSNYLVLCRGCFLKATGKKLGTSRHKIKLIPS